MALEAEVFIAQVFCALIHAQTHIIGVGGLGQGVPVGFGIIERHGSQFPNARGEARHGLKHNPPAVVRMRAGVDPSRLAVGWKCVF